MASEGTGITNNAINDVERAQILIPNVILKDNMVFYGYFFSFLDLVKLVKYTQDIHFEYKGI